MAEERERAGQEDRTEQAEDFDAAPAPERRAAGGRWKVLWIPLAVLALVLAVFGGWYLIPARPLDVAVLDKTVPAAGKGADTVLNNRKHFGLFWLLEEQRYRNPQTGRLYNYLTDYYGEVEKNGQMQTVSMARLGRTPDMVYLADVYGAQEESGGGTEAVGGLEYADMAAAAAARLNGATLIAESDIFSGGTEESVQKEAETAFGVTYQGWTGRYIKDMSDLSDVPAWAQSLHESQFGRPWSYTGAGILLVSDSGKLVVLETADFADGTPALKVAVTEEYRKEFGRLSVNYYNWFVLVSAGYGTDTVAQYSLNLSGAGREKFSEVSDAAVFPAALRVRSGDDGGPAWFFAGDFNDYVARKRSPGFLFSGEFYRMLSYDKPGDITNFYWNFYAPLMKTILKQTEARRDEVSQPGETESTPAFRIRNGRFETLQNGSWTAFAVKGFNLRADLPGGQAVAYTRDMAVYRQFLKEIGEMSATCVRAYDLLPPEFYLALAEYNRKHADAPLALFQSVGLPASVTPGEALSDAAREAVKAEIRTVVDALHGKATVSAEGARTGGEYIQDVSPWLAGYLVDSGADAESVAALNSRYAGYAYEGDYVSSDTGGAEGLLALMCDTVYTCQAAYGGVLPVGAGGDPALLPGLPWSLQGVSFQPASLAAGDKTGGSFFVALPVQPDDAALLNNTAAYASYNDSQGSLPYGGYLRAVLAGQTAYPVLIDRVGISTNANAYEKETGVNGLSEAEQGQTMVRLLTAVGAAKCLGGLVADYNDSWAAPSAEYGEYELPAADSPLWQNLLDPAQTRGLTAVSPQTENAGTLSLRDNDRMQEMTISSDAAYLYITVQLSGNVDYDAQQMFIGLDTYQRNNGEYLYDPACFGNSLSGMEFVIKFESRNSAGLFVVPEYNRAAGRYASKESYTGKFDYVGPLVYGSFDGTGSHFNQTGSTIRLRLPWSMLNVADPAKRLVISDSRSAAEIAADPFGLQTTATDGIMVSLMIADKQTGDTLYLFPLNKESPAYKAYSWEPWTKVKFTLRQKEGCKLLAAFFRSR